MDSALRPVSFQPPRNLQTPPPCSLHFLEVYWLTFQERRGGLCVPAVTGAVTNHFMERATCLLWSPSVPSPYLQPGGPGTGQTFTLSRIDWPCLLPPGTDHLFSGWYKWNWLEQGLIDLLTHVSWHSGDNQAWREWRTITWSLPGPQTRGITGVQVSTSVTKSLPRKTQFAFHCVCKNLQLSKKKNKEINDGVSLKVLALNTRLWFIPFEISTLAQVCVRRERCWCPCLKSFCIRVILMSPLHLWLTLFQTTKWCVSFSRTMIKGAGVLREACLKRIHLVTHIVLLLYS